MSELESARAEYLEKYRAWQDWKPSIRERIAMFICSDVVPKAWVEYAEASLRLSWAKTKKF